MDEGILFSYSIKTVSDPDTTWMNRMDHYYQIGKFEVHEEQILVSFAIMFVTSCFALTYIRISVKRDFAVLAAASDPDRANNSTSISMDTSHSVDSEGRNVIGGLEIVSDASELVGWQRLKDDVFRPPNESTLMGVLLGVGA